jgi:hypothetical protein
MTALQVAKQECANCDSAGNCAGVGIRDDGSLYRFRREGEKCWLAPGPDGAIARCLYFEECVAPLAKARARNAATQDQKHAAAKLAEGVRAYEAAAMPVSAAKYAKCKGSGCQRDVIAPKRLCEQCAKKRTLQSKRQYWSKTRKSGALGALIANDL